MPSTQRIGISQGAMHNPVFGSRGAFDGRWFLELGVPVCVYELYDVELGKSVYSVYEASRVFCSWIADAERLSL